MRIKNLFRFFFLISFWVLSSASAASPNPDPEGLTPLHRAAGRGDVDLMRQLCNGGADVNALDSQMGVSVLHKAVYSGSTEAVKFLLQRGALVNLVSNSNGNTPLHDSIYFKKKKEGLALVSLLLSSGASLSIRNRAGLSPIESAKALNDLETVKLLEEETHRRFSASGIALMQAVRKNDLKKAKELLVDPRMPLEEADDQGFTPLLWASREGMSSMVKLLLEKGADPNHLDVWMGANAGHKAAFWGHAEVMGLLVAHRLEINARGKYNGYTALHDAVSGRHWDVARALVEAGARKDIRGHDGKSPIDIARENNDTKMLALLGGKT